MHPWSIRLESIISSKALPYGKKTERLASVARARFPVPMSYVVTPEAYAFFLGETSAREVVSSLPRRSLKKMVQALDTLELSPRLLELTTSIWEAFDKAGVYSVVVRPSGFYKEDAPGQVPLSLSLNIISHAQLVRAFKYHWLYNAQRPRDPSVRKSGHSLIVQAMVAAEFSGEALSRGLGYGDIDEAWVKVQQGLLLPRSERKHYADLYRIDPDALELIEFHRGNQHEALRLRRGGGVLKRALTSSTSDNPSQALMLSHETAAKVAQLSQRLGTFLKYACVVQFGVIHDEAYVFDVRPLPQLFALRPRRRRRRKYFPYHVDDKQAPADVWSRSMPATLYPTVITPLSWSLLTHYGDSALREGLRSMGAHVQDGQRLLAVFRGRAWLNWSVVSDCLNQIPGFKPASLELGWRGLEPLERQVLQAAAERQTGLRAWSRLPKVLARITQHNLGKDARINLFEQTFFDDIKRLSQVDMRVLPAQALGHVLADAERILGLLCKLWLPSYLSLWTATAVWKAVGAISGDTTADMLDYFCNRGLARSIIQEVESISKLLSGGIIERSSFVSVPPLDLATAIGHWSLAGLEVIEPRWSERPEYLNTLWAALAERMQREFPLAKRDERPLRQIFDKSVLLRFRSRAVHYLRLTDDLYRLASLIRSVAKEASRRFALSFAGIADDSAFFLSSRELYLALIEPPRTFVELILERREIYERYRQEPCSVWAFEHHNATDTWKKFDRRYKKAETTEGFATHASGRGHAEGTAFRLEYPWALEELAKRKDKPIVLCDTCPDGFVSMLGLFGGVAASRGSTLSMTSFFARALETPWAVGLGDALTSVRDGDKVTITNGKLSVSDSRPAYFEQPAQPHAQRR